MEKFQNRNIVKIDKLKQIWHNRNYKEVKTMDELEAILGIFLTFIMAYVIIILVISLACIILRIIARWKIFVKAGEEGWKAIVPIYSSITLYKLIGLSPWLLFIYLAGLIPFIPTWTVTLGMSIPVSIKLAKAFHKDEGYTVGLIFLPVIFEMMLAFGKAEYEFNNEVKAEVISEEVIKEDT